MTDVKPVEVVCPRCKAHPTEGCVTPKGTLVVGSHKERLWAAKDATRAQRIRGEQK